MQATLAFDDTSSHAVEHNQTIVAVLDAGVGSTPTEIPWDKEDRGA
jgi:hypothetical protein